MKRFVRIAVSSLMLVTLACNFLTDAFKPGTVSQPGAAPLEAAGEGPKGLTAEATSADSVKLTWQPVDGASLYRLRVSFAGGEALTVMDVAAPATSYEDFLAMPGGGSTYAVEALSDSGSLGQSVVDVTTPERKPDPLSVDVQLDAGNTASATIGPEGGSLSLKDAKGVEYQLEIPAGALSSPMPISLIAVQAIGSWPLDGDLRGAVKIEPDGLQLRELATLSITLPGAAPSGDLSNLGFAFSGAGKEFHLQPMLRADNTTTFAPGSSGPGHAQVMPSAAGDILQFFLSQLNGTGVGAGTAENARELPQYHPPSDNGAALDQKNAAAERLIESERLQEQGSQEDLSMYIYADAVMLSIVGAKDCAGLKNAVQKMDSFENRGATAKLRGVNLPDLIDAEGRALWYHLLNQLDKVIRTADEECKKKPKDKPAASEAGCLDALISRIANPVSAFDRQLNAHVKGDKKFDDLGQVWDRLHKCKPQSYRVSGNAGGASWEGQICDLNKPFQVIGRGQAENFYSMAPSSESGGLATLLGAKDGCSWTGGGSYTVQLDEGGGGTLVIHETEILTCSGGGSSGTFTWPLDLNPVDITCP